jgi:hypothetical protein
VIGKQWIVPIEPPARAIAWAVALVRHIFCLGAVLRQLGFKQEAHFEKTGENAPARRVHRLLGRREKISLGDVRNAHGDVKQLTHLRGLVGYL